MSYALLDSGSQRKLERFGPYILSRPSSQALWRQALPGEAWAAADAIFEREELNSWLHPRRSLPREWEITLEGITFRIAPTDFGHVGLFPEQLPMWRWIEERIKEEKSPVRCLNLFAYSGGATLAAARAGAEVCHVDASKGMCDWAVDNAARSNLRGKPIRWICDDARKFVGREIKRGVNYDAVILDPPTFGRGAKGEVFKIEDDLPPLLDGCRQLLSARPRFVLLSCHTPGLTPIILHHLLSQMMAGHKGVVESGEMVLSGEKALPLPSGTYARWRRAT